MKKEIKKSEFQRHSEFQRSLFLLMVIVVGVIAYVAHIINDAPAAIIDHTIENALKQTFKASLEGGISINNRNQDAFRVHYSYQPKTGITVDPPVITDMPPFDPVTAMNLICAVPDPREYRREDMYNVPARHFGGTFHYPAEDSTQVYVFNYWINMATNEAVRLEISGVQRNADIDAGGNPVSREIYLNMRFYNFGR